MKVKEYLRLMRPHNYIKNVLILIPAFFGKSLFSWHNICVLVIGFVLFSLVSSLAYIFNDINDAEADRLHIRILY